MGENVLGRIRPGGKVSEGESFQGDPSYTRVCLPMCIHCLLQLIEIKNILTHLLRTPHLPSRSVEYRPNVFAPYFFFLWISCQPFNITGVVGGPSGYIQLQWKIQGPMKTHLTVLMSQCYIILK